MGLILGKLGESSFSKSMQLLNYEPMALFARPIAAFLLTAADNHADLEYRERASRPCCRRRRHRWRNHDEVTMNATLLDRSNADDAEDHHR